MDDTPVNVSTGITNTSPPEVALQLAIGRASFTAVMSEATAAQVGPLVAQHLAAAVEAARRARLGIVVAAPGDVPTMLNDRNGHGDRRGI